jgi:hypothetical protein
LRYDKNELKFNITDKDKLFVGNCIVQNSVKKGPPPFDKEAFKDVCNQVVYFKVILHKALKIRQFEQDNSAYAEVIRATKIELE